MSDDRFPKKALNGKPGGRRNKGRPHARWNDGVCICGFQGTSTSKVIGISIINL